MTAAAGAFAHPEMSQILLRLRERPPLNLTMARYRDLAGNDWSTAVASYGSSSRAQLVWWITRYAALASMQPVKLSGKDALYRADPSGRIVLFRKGPFLAIVGTPPGASSEQLQQLADAIQI